MNASLFGFNRPDIVPERAIQIALAIITAGKLEGRGGCAFLRLSAGLLLQPDGDLCSNEPVK